MDKDRLLLTQNVRKLKPTGIKAVDDVHNFIYEIRRDGVPCQSVKLRPHHFEIYAVWVAKNIGFENVYDKTGQVAAPLTVDGVGIEMGLPVQSAYILPVYLPSDQKRADKYRDFRDLHGKLPEHHSQI
jgi:hypothetical protein